MWCSSLRLYNKSPACFSCSGHISSLWRHTLYRRCCRIHSIHKTCIILCYGSRNIQSSLLIHTHLLSSLLRLPTHFFCSLLFLPHTPRVHVGVKLSVSWCKCLLAFANNAFAVILSSSFRGCWQRFALSVLTCSASWEYNIAAAWEEEHSVSACSHCCKF